MRSDSTLAADVREKERWKGPSLRRWNMEKRGDIGVSLSGGERNHLFLNSGGRRFDDVSGVSGLDNEADSRGFVLFDYDRDGWQDIALINTNAPLLNLYRNQIGDVEGAGGRSIALRLVGGNRTAQPSAKLSNRDGVGARIRVSLGDTALVREHRAGEGFATQNSATLLIGIGARDSAASVSVRWPTGAVQETRDVPAGTLLTVYENPADAPGTEAIARSPYASPPPSLPSGPLEGERLALAHGGPAESPRPAFVVYTTMATWCPACKRNLPQGHIVREAFDRSELAFVGLPIDPEDTPEMLAAYVDEHAPAYELWIDAPRDEVARVQARVIEEFHKDVLPASIVTDAEGRVIEFVPGVPSVSEVRRLMSGDQAEGEASTRPAALPQSR